MVGAGIRAWVIAACAGFVVSAIVQTPLALAGVGDWWRIAAATIPVTLAFDRVLKHFDRVRVDA